MTTVDHHLDSVPVVDLRLLTQSELYSLSLSSSSSSASHRFDDDVLIPKIDRSVFNESAGSRKQTYSRLRLAPRNTTAASSSASASNSESAVSRHLLSQPLDHESRQIISLLKQLFPSENQNDVVLEATPPPQYRYLALPAPELKPQPNPYSVYGAAGAVSGVDSSTGKRKRGRPRKDSYAVVARTEAPVSSAAVTAGGGEARDGNAGDLIEKGDVEATAVGTFVLNSEGQLVLSSEGKRKRGRPRKDEVRAVVAPVTVRKPRVKKEEVKEEDGDMVLVNGDDVAVDLDALADADSVFAEELRKRTEGLEGEAQLLGFLEGLEGDWSSARKKRKIVQASEFGDLLPKWWKILLALKREGGHKSLMCRRFISPNGLEFVSCKEVSSYLHSYFGLGSQSNTDHTIGNNQVSNKMVLGNGMQQDTSFSYEDNNNGHELLHCSPMPMTSMNSYVKGIEVAGEVMGMRKKLDPVKSGRLGTSSKIQEPVEIDGDDLGSGFSLDKVNDIMAKYFATSIDEPSSMSCEEQAMQADKTICSSDGLNDDVRVATSSVDVPNVEIDRASNEMEKEHGADNTENHQSTSTVDDMKIDDVDNCMNGRSISGISESHIGPETANSNVDQQSTSEACSLVPSNMMESLHGRGSDSGLYSTATDEKACVDNFNNDSFSTLYDRRFIDIGLTGSNEKTFCFSGDRAMPDVDSMEVSERILSTGSCSVVLPLDGQSCIDNATNPCCAVDKQEKSLASNAFRSFVDKQTPGNLNKGGIDTVERHKVQHAKNYDNSELSGDFCSRATGTNVDTTSYINQERSSTGCSLASYANEHASVSENSFVSNSILEELQPGRGTSETDLVCPSGYQQGYNLVNHANGTSSRPTFGSSCSGQEANAFSGTVTGINAQAPSLVLSEDNELFATDSGIFSNSVLNDTLIRVPVNGLPHPIGGEQTPDFASNLNRVYSTTLWEQSKSMSAEHSNDNEYINGFLNESQPIADSMSDLMWKNVEQNVQQSGLADTSSALMQSSGSSYPNFDMLSGKGENGALSKSEQFDNTQRVEGLKSSRLEQFEPDFLTAQATSQSKESNVLSYDESIEQGFNSSGWPDKGALSSVPNIESRREIDNCVWCRNELYPDAYGAGMQTGSVGIMCANCQGKFSGNG